MRTRLLVFALVAALPAALPAQQERDSILTVTVNRTARIPADRAIVYITVESTAETAVDAVARVDAKVKTVLEALQRMAPRATPETPIALTVGSAQNATNITGNTLPAGNLARTLIRVNVDRIDQLSHIVAAAIAAGATGPASITFSATTADSIRTARSIEAVATARRNAAQIAGSLGLRLGAIVDVNVSDQYGYQQPPTLNFDQRYGGQQQQTPEVTITANATLRVRIVR